MVPLFAVILSLIHFVLLSFEKSATIAAGDWGISELLLLGKGWEHRMELALWSAGAAVLTAMGTSPEQCPPAGGASSAFEGREPSKRQPPLAPMPLIGVV